MSYRTLLGEPSLTTTRSLFLLGCQKRYPTFWKTLNQVWRSRDMGALKPWMEERCVTDEWLKEAVLKTLYFWEQTPDSPSAALAEGFFWFSGDTTEDFGDFEPKLKDPYPIVLNRPQGLPVGSDTAAFSMDEVIAFSRDLLIEGVPQFQARMRGQFEEQLKEYSKRYLLSVNQDAHPQQSFHADLTALAFAGVPIADIARGFSQFKRNRDAGSAAGKAISRFAGSIGLTLPVERLTKPKSVGTFAGGSPQKVPKS